MSTWYGEEDTEVDEVDAYDDPLPVSSFLAPLDISEVLRGQLFLSDRYIAQHLGVLARHKISHVLTISRVNINRFPGLAYKWLDADDVAHENLMSRFADAHAFIDEALSNKGACLVHCDAGVSRSPTIVISYLMRSQKMSYDEAFSFVKSARPVVNPNPGFRKQLMRFEAVLSGASECDDKKLCPESKECRCFEISPASPPRLSAEATITDIFMGAFLECDQQQLQEPIAVSAQLS